MMKFVCVSNAEKCNNYANKVLVGHWTFLGPGSGEKWYGSHDKKGSGIAQPTKCYSDSKRLVILYSKVSVLSRGVLKQKKGKTSIHFNGDSMNTELVFQTVHSVNQRAVANWCFHFIRFYRR